MRCFNAHRQINKVFTGLHTCMFMAYALWASTNDNCDTRNEFGIYSTFVSLQMTLFNSTTFNVLNGLFQHSVCMP